MILFEKTHSLANILQSKQMDIAKAIEFAEITCTNFVSIKSDMDSCEAFNELYDKCEMICNTNNIDVPVDNVPKGKRKRASNPNQNINLKETFQTIYDKIIDIYAHEIQERFKKDNLIPVLELFNVIMVVDEKNELNYDNLKIYDNLINLRELKYELKPFIQYKQRHDDIKWNTLSEVIQVFVKNDLKTPFPQIYMCLKLYLTIPVSTAEGERSFSVLKLLKSFKNCCFTYNNVAR